jgi:hypothetical protein
MEDVHIENSSERFWLLDGDNIQNLRVDQFEIEVEFYMKYVIMLHSK